MSKKGAQMRFEFCVLQDLQSFVPVFVFYLCIRFVYSCICLFEILGPLLPYWRRT